jgi:hypothetical protein
LGFAAGCCAHSFACSHRICAAISQRENEETRTTNRKDYCGIDVFIKKAFDK